MFTIGHNDHRFFTQDAYQQRFIPDNTVQGKGYINGVVTQPALKIQRGSLTDDQFDLRIKPAVFLVARTAV
jgi:hypothetical protein